MGFLQGKRALITGIASERSIASGIAEAMHREGAELAFTYQNEKLKPRVEAAAKEFGSDIVIPLDVTSDAQISECFGELGKHCVRFTKSSKDPDPLTYEEYLTLIEKGCLHPIDEAAVWSIWEGNARVVR